MNTEIIQNKQVQAGIHDEVSPLALQQTHVNSGRVLGTEVSLLITYRPNHIRN